MSETILLTGAAGFIGSHLADALLGRGHTVVGVDNLLTGTHANLQAARTAGLVFVEADVAGEWPRVEAAFLEAVGQPDLVLHFASPASPIHYGTHPLDTLRANSRGAELAADFALRHQARFLFASTSEIYGDPLEHPQRESYWGNVNPVGPRACYDEGKRYGEAVTSTMARVLGLDARIVRIFNTYGPRMALCDGRAVPNFIRQALSGEPLTVYGLGSQTRSFCYVDDLVEGILRAATVPMARGRVVNLGNPAESTISELAETVARLTGATLNVTYAELPPDDPTRRCPDIVLAQELLGWHPRVGIEEGLQHTIADFRRRLN